MMVLAGRWHAGAAQSVKPVEATAFKMFVAGQNQNKRAKNNNPEHQNNGESKMANRHIRSNSGKWQLVACLLEFDRLRHPCGYSTHCAVCTIDTTGGISYSTAYTDIRYEICDGCVVDSAVTVCVL